MPLEPENECACGQWKGVDFDSCRDCSGELVTIGYHARVRETDLAVLFRISAGMFTGREVWVPKKILESEVEGAQEFEVPRWWAEQEDLI